MNVKLSLALAAITVLLVACTVPAGGPLFPFATVYL